MTAQTGQTENTYLYAGEVYDRTTELYYLRARYMDPSAGVFLSMDPYQGNMHDPVSLHKYLYANANPITYTDPTGNFSLGDLQTATGIDNILEGARNHNYIQLLIGIKDSLKFIRLSSSYINMFTCAMLGDTEGFLVNMANVYISAADILNICEMATVAQMMTKALAVYDIFGRMDCISEGLENGEIMKVLWNIIMVAMDVSIITATCFTGDTLVAVEGGQKRMDELELFLVK